MALIKVKPTSPGRRAVVQVSKAGLHKGKPFAALVESKSKNAGRNNNGRITVRHQGGGHKQSYRIIDFKRDKDGVPGKVERIEYDPNRTGISRWFVTPMASVVTSLPTRAWWLASRS